MALAKEGAAVLEAVGISKHFGHVTALDDVSLGLRAGEITALVGDNGAGKSTFVGIIAGLIQPDEGRINLVGEDVRLANPAHAKKLGIATVFQDLALVPQRDVAANIFAGRELCRLGVFVDRRRMIREATNLIADLKVSLPSVRTKVAELSGGQRQATALVRAFMDQNVITILDEPTAALGVRESRRVLELVGRLSERGQAVLMVSHNLESVFQFADQIVVMRLGRVRAHCATSDTSREEIVALITGAAQGNMA